MKRTILLGILFLLIVGGAPLAGAPIPGATRSGLGAEVSSCTYKQAADYLRTTADHYLTGNRSLVDETILLIDLEESLAIGDRVIFEILQDGERRLLEEQMVKVDDLAIALDLEAPALDSPVLELLGAEPGLRAHLRAQAAEGADLRVAVHINGRQLADRTIADVVAASDRLRVDGPLPLATERWGKGSRAVLASPRSGGAFFPTKSCQSTCDALADDCYDECVFSPGGGSSCFAACDAEYDECLDSCNGGGGGCTPSSTSTTQDSVVSRTPVGPIRCLEFPFPFNIFDDYIRTRERNRRVTTTITTHADCSQTTSTTTTFFNTFCWNRHSPGCTAPITFGIFCDT